MDWFEDSDKVVIKNDITTWTVILPASVSTFNPRDNRIGAF